LVRVRSSARQGAPDFDPGMRRFVSLPPQNPQKTAIFSRFPSSIVLTPGASPEPAILSYLYLIRRGGISPDVRHAESVRVGCAAHFLG
jgi:hypothetical protein